MIYLYNLDMMSQYNLHEYKISDYNTNSACFYISALPNHKFIKKGHPAMQTATRISYVKRNCILLYKSFEELYEQELLNTYSFKAMNDIINRYKSISDYSRKDK